MSRYFLPIPLISSGGRPILNQTVTLHPVGDSETIVKTLTWSDGGRYYWTGGEAEVPATSYDVYINGVLFAEDVTIYYYAFDLPSAGITNVLPFNQTVLAAAEKDTVAIIDPDYAPTLDTTNWTLGTGWESPADVLNKNADGTGTATPTATTNIISGRRYKVVITLSSWSVGSCSYTLGGTAGTTILDSATTFTHYITAVNTNKIIFTPTNTSRFTISSLSIKEQVGGYVPFGYYYRPRMVYYNNKTYIVYTLGGIAGNYRQTNYVMYYDHITQTFSAATDVGPSVSGTDIHHPASIEISDDGYIIVAFDPIPGNIHNLKIQVKRSTAAEDISAFTDLGYIQESAADCPGSYPYFQKLANGDIFLFWRGGTNGAYHNYLKCAKSEDGGSTWGDAYTIAYISTTERWAYSTVGIKSSINDDLSIVCVPSATGQVGHRVLILRSADGITWRNEENTFSKDVVNNAAITITESETYFTAYYDATNTVTITTSIIFNNKVYCIIAVTSTTPRIKYLLYYNGDAWVATQIPEYMFSYASDYDTAGHCFLIIYDDNVIDLFSGYKQNGDSVLTVLKKYRTYDLGASWGFVENVIASGDPAISTTYPVCTSYYADIGQVIAACEKRESSILHDIFYKVYGR